MNNTQKYGSGTRTLSAGASRSGFHYAHPALDALGVKKKGLRNPIARAGVSLLEITFVLLIIVGVVGGALIMASGAMSQSTVTQEIQTLNNLASGASMTKTTRGYGGGDGDGKDLLPDMEIIGSLPKNIVMAGSTPKNSWSGDITIVSSNGGADFIITYANIPKEECVKLVNGVKMGILRSVGTGTGTDTSMLDVGPAKAAEICGAAAGAMSGVSEVSWSTENM